MKVHAPHLDILLSTQTASTRMSDVEGSSLEEALDSCELRPR